MFKTMPFVYEGTDPSVFSMDKGLNFQNHLIFAFFSLTLPWPSG